MKILVLCSGGDAPGMNRVLWKLSTYFPLYYACAGYRGLCQGDIKKLKSEDIEKHKDEAGTIIYSSRFPEFKEKEYFDKGAENAKKFDYVVVIGGNGSEKGARELAEAGVNVMFLPGSIDNDIEDSYYSIGFDSAVNQCVYTVENSMPSANAFMHPMFFEVMGRDNPSIAQETARRVNADYLITKDADFDPIKISKIVKNNILKGRGTAIIVMEKIHEISYYVEKLNEVLGGTYSKKQVVGRLQRGGKPTKKELKMCDRFADALAKEITFGHVNKRILVGKDGKMKIYDLV